MKLSSLKSLKSGARAAKRVGRGESSGKGKTAGRGMKGQKARGAVKPEFEGGQLPIIKRLPFQKGVGNKPSKQAFTITLRDLSKLKEGATVELRTLKEANLIPKQNVKVKVVATGNLTKTLVVKLPVTKKAKEAIEKAKGKVLND